MPDHFTCIHTLVQNKVQKFTFDNASTDDNISDDCFKHSVKTFLFIVDIDVPSAVEVFTTQRYTNLHFLTLLYLLTYLTDFKKLALV